MIKIVIEKINQTTNSTFLITGNRAIQYAEIAGLTDQLNYNHLDTIESHYYVYPTLGDEVSNSTGPHLLLPKICDLTVRFFPFDHMPNHSFMIKEVENYFLSPYAHSLEMAKTMASTLAWKAEVDPETLLDTIPYLHTLTIVIKVRNDPPPGYYTITLT